MPEYELRTIKDVQHGEKETTPFWEKTASDYARPTKNRLVSLIERTNT